MVGERNTMITLDDVRELDLSDTLSFARERFVLPANNIYLDGNSLGVLPKSVEARVNDVVQRQWGQDLISSWNKHGWIDLSLQVGSKIAGLIGAQARDVVCTDSISVNLFKALGAAKSINPARRIVLSTVDNFPTDLYMVQGLSQLLGEHAIELKLVEESQLESALDDSVMAVLLSHVNFRTGAILDMQHLTSVAHDCGALTIWDLAHSAGALEVAVDQFNVDFAVGCTYKYLNSGPGAPAFIYCNRKIVDRVQQPLTGWMGHANAFEFNPVYKPNSGIKKFLAGTPPIIAVACVDAALDVFDNVSMQDLRKKSIALSELFESLLMQAGLGEQLVAIHPAESASRGSQLAYANDHAYGLCQSLIERGVTPDFRAPNYIRFGFTPLYTSFEDVWKAVEALKNVIEEGAHKDERWSTKLAVT